MVVVAPRGAPYRHPRLAPVERPRNRDVRYEYGVRIFRIDHDLLEIPAAPPERLISRCARPRFPAIVRPEEPSLPRCRVAPETARTRRLDRRTRLRHEAVDHRVD